MRADADRQIRHNFKLIDKPDSGLKSYVPKPQPITFRLVPVEYESGSYSL